MTALAELAIQLKELGLLTITDTEISLNVSEYPPVEKYIKQLKQLGLPDPLIYAILDTLKDSYAGKLDQTLIKHWASFRSDTDS